MNEDHPENLSEDEPRGGQPLSLTTVFRALADQRRRTVLYCLSTCSRPVPLEEIVTEVTVQEAEAHEADIPAELTDRITLDLHCVQLPKLADLGIIEYNRTLKLARIADTIRPLDEYLRLAEQYDHREERHDSL